MTTEPHTEPRALPKKLLVRGGLVVLALAAVYFLVVARGREEAEGRAGGFGGGMGMMGAFGPAVVETAPVRRGSFEIWGEWVGTLEARARAELYAKADGQVVAVLADTGDRVREGQLLARIDAADQRERIDQLQAAVAMADATLAQRRAAHEIARTTAARTESLFTQQLVALQQHEAAQAELKGAEAQVDVARAALAQARANLSAGRVELEKTRISAPFSGWVGERHLDLGAFAAGNQPVFTLVDLSTIEISIPLTEKDSARVRVGQPAVLTVEALGGAQFQGHVARIASLFDPRTNTAQAEVEVANPDGRLKPGMFANVAVALQTAPDALLVPRAALVEQERATYVFVVGPAAAGTGRDAAAAGERDGERDDGEGDEGPALVADRVEVEVLGTGGVRQRDVVAVEGALRPGAQVITLGQQELRDGSAVTVAAADGRPAGAAEARP